MKALIACLLTLTLLTGCLTTGPNSPAANTAQEVQAQHAAVTAAVSAYCGAIQDSDSEMQQICASVMPAVGASTAVIQTALNLIIATLAKREAVARMTRSQLEQAECHK